MAVPAGVAVSGGVLALGLSVEPLFLGLAVTSDRIAGWRIVGVTAALGHPVDGAPSVPPAPTAPRRQRPGGRRR